MDSATLKSVKNVSEEYNYFELKNVLKQLSIEEDVIRYIKGISKKFSILYSCVRTDLYLYENDLHSEHYTLPLMQFEIAELIGIMKFEKSRVESGGFDKTVLSQVSHAICDRLTKMSKYDKERALQYFKTLIFFSRNSDFYGYDLSLEDDGTFKKIAIVKCNDKKTDCGDF